MECSYLFVFPWRSKWPFSNEIWLFSPCNDEFKKRVTFKVREVNYEHFLITIKLEFQKAISNRAWITNWQIVASWIRIFKCLYKIFPCRSFLEVSSCSSWSAYSTHLGFLARYRNLSWYFLYSESKYLTLMTTRKSNNRNYH